MHCAVEKKMKCEGGILASIPMIPGETREQGARRLVIHFLNVMSEKKDLNAWTPCEKQAVACLMHEVDGLNPEAFKDSPEMRHFKEWVGYNSHAPHPPIFVPNPPI